MSKTILVTGGAGFIGSHVVDVLINRGDRVVMVDDYNDFYNPDQKRLNLRHLRDNPNLEVIGTDIRAKKLSDIFSKYTFDAVIHLAARAGVRPSLLDPKLYWDVNVMGTLNLLEAMRAAGVNQLVFASSSSIYGNRTDGPFKESDPTDRQVSPYGASKKAGELLCHTYAHLYGIKTTCLRFFTVYGPKNRPDLACFKFMDAIIHGRPIDQYGDGQTGRDYTYVADTVAGILAALQSTWNYEIINLGNSHPILLKDMIATIAATVGKPPIIQVQPKQPGDVEFTFADITKAKQQLGWEPQTPFADGIQKMWQWYRQS